LPNSDVVYVNAGATRPEAHWLEALRVGGRLIFPLTSNQGAGVMALVTRRGERKYDARIVMGAAFIPCVGTRDDKESEALMPALTKDGRHMAIRSLNRDANPDETCWLRREDWWFSSRGS
jgi:protein-L-isoaspartate(D-aspartate) O-methyltransferase